VSCCCSSGTGLIAGITIAFIVGIIVIVCILHRCVGRNRRPRADGQEAKPPSEHELVPRFVPSSEPVTLLYTIGRSVSALRVPTYPRTTAAQPPTSLQDIPATEHLTAEQLALVDSMFIRSIPASEITAAIENMRAEREDPNAPPPAYGSD
jgi:hypothetical protein